MAISSGVNPHRAWLTVGGFLIPVKSGSAEQAGTRRSSHFSAVVPLNYPGARQALANPGDAAAGVICQTNGITGTLVLGEFDNIEFNYGENGTISVTGRCNSTKLHNKKTFQKWVNQTTTSIVQQLCSQAGLGCSASGGFIAGKLIQQDYTKLGDGQSYASIISKCAELDCARWWVDPQSTLHYEIGAQGGGGYSVTYNAGPPESADFLRLSIKRNVQASKQIQCEVKSWHTKDKKEYDGQGSAGGQGGGNVQYGYNIPGLKQNQCQQWAQSKANEVAHHAITVSAHVVGDPSITVDSGLSVSGTDFDGSYVIDKVHHQFGMSGHTMTIEAKVGVGD